MRLTVPTVVFVLTAVALPAQQPERIMFGSCLAQWRDHPALSVAVERDPDAFVFLGDNVYADSANPDVIRQAYDRLAVSPRFRELMNTTRVFATWDDHDYGLNDAGRDFRVREASEAIFESFWDVTGPARERPGVYQAVELGGQGSRVQLILLDTRYFRSPLERARPRPEGKGPYAVREGTGTILGDEQWAWFERVLRRPADLRVVASSIQVLAEHHGWESWANFSHERERLLSLLAQSGAPAVIVSGDRHFAELSRRTVTADGREVTLVDATSSGINRGYPEPTPTENDRRVDDYYLGHNVGELELTWPEDDGPPSVRIRIYDTNGGVRVEYYYEPGA